LLFPSSLINSLSCHQRETDRQPAAAISRDQYEQRGFGAGLAAMKTRPGSLPVQAQPTIGNHCNFF